MPAFDPAMGSYSPGKALLARMIEDAMRDGFTRFDLLTGSEPYKTVWQTDEVPLSSCEEPCASTGTRIRAAANRAARRLAALKSLYAFQRQR